MSLPVGSRWCFTPEDADFGPPARACGDYGRPCTIVGRPPVITNYDTRGGSWFVFDDADRRNPNVYSDGTWWAPDDCFSPNPT